VGAGLRRARGEARAACSALAAAEPVVLGVERRRELHEVRRGAAELLLRGDERVAERGGEDRVLGEAALHASGDGVQLREVVGEAGDVGPREHVLHRGVRKARVACGDGRLRIHARPDRGEVDLRRGRGRQREQGREHERASHSHTTRTTLLPVSAT
jgi:hypothetical protein